MPYSHIQELPDQVRASYDDTDAKAWMKAYNKHYDELVGDDENPDQIKQARFLAWKDCMDLPSSFAVEEWATVEDVDSDGEVVTLSSILEHIDKFVDYGGAMQDTHSNLPLAHVWGAEERVHEKTGLPGVVVYYNMYGGTEAFDNGRKEWMEGKNHLSVGGNADYGGYECDDRGCFVKRNVTSLYEISLCEVPANPHASVIDYHEGRLNKRFTKSRKDEKILNIRPYMRKVHSDYNYCRMQAVHKAMRDVGVPCTCQMDGYHVKVQTEDRHILPLMRSLDNMGMVYSYNTKENTFIVKNAEDTYNLYKDECLTKGYILPDGTLTGRMSKDVFFKLFSYDMLDRGSKGWFMKEPGAMTASTGGASNPIYGGQGKTQTIGYNELQRFKDRIERKG